MSSLLLPLGVAACGGPNQAGADAATVDATTVDATVDAGSGTQARSGMLDPSFGQGGLVETTFGLGLFHPSVATSVAVRADRSIVVGGWYDTGGVAYFGDVTDPAIAQYLPDGTLDPAFAYGDGALLLDSGGTRWGADSVAIGADRSTIFAGTMVAGITDSTTTFTSSATVGRLTSAGAPDSSFAAAGVLTTTPSPDAPDNADVVAIDADGVLFAGAETTVIGSAADPTYAGNFVLWKSNTSGQLDAAFGTAGKTVVAGPSGSTYSSISTIAYQSTGAIVALGTSMLPGNTESGALLRFTADGVLDPTFGVGGTLALPGGCQMAIANDDTIETVCWVNDESVLSRWRADGTADTSFGSGGQIALPIAINTFAFQPDGKILGIGQSGTGNATRTTVMRYLPDGTLDPAFAIGGVFTGIAQTVGYALAVAPDGGIVVAGAINNDGISSFAVWRLLP